jgi:hypothetical protein
MSKSREEFELAIDNLKYSKTEDEILSHLTFIVKGFNISLYKDILISNPYYKSLLEDVKEDVLFDLKKNATNVSTLVTDFYVISFIIFSVIVTLNVFIAVMTSQIQEKLKVVNKINDDDHKIIVNTQDNIEKMKKSFYEIKKELEEIEEKINKLNEKR